MVEANSLHESYFLSFRRDMTTDILRNYSIGNITSSQSSTLIESSCDMVDDMEIQLGTLKDFFYDHRR